MADCDGGSWTGDAAAPVTVGDETIHYRGRPLLDALLQWLLAEGLSSASELLYGGCSAGGLTTYLHCDYVAGVMPPSYGIGIFSSAFSPRALPQNPRGS